MLGYKYMYQYIKSNAYLARSILYMCIYSNNSPFICVQTIYIPHTNSIVIAKSKGVFILNYFELKL